MDAVVQRKISTIGPKKMRLVIVVWPCPEIRICCPLFSRRRSLYRMSWTVGYQALIYSPDIQISGYTWNKNASENNVHLTLFYLQYSEMFVLNYYQKQNTTHVYHALIIFFTNVCQMFIIITSQRNVCLALLSGNVCCDFYPGPKSCL